MSKRKLLSDRRRSRLGRRLCSEQLESRQLLAADFGMFGAVTSNFSQIRSGTRFDVGALVSQLQQRNSGEINVSLDAIRERLSSNPAANELIQNKLQGIDNAPGFLNRVAEKARERGVEINLEPKDKNLEVIEAGTPTETYPQMEEAVAATLEVPVDSGATPAGQPRREVVRARIMDRLDGKLPEFVVLAEDGTVDRTATREIIRAKVADGEVADKIRDRIKDRFDGELPEFVVLAEDGTVDREATREIIRAKIADGEVADKIRDRIKDRLDGELPEFVVLAEDSTVDREATREIIRAKVADGEVADKIRDRIKDRLDGELPEFVVLAEDGTIDREATRENIRAKVADGEVADKIRDRIKDRLDGELPEFVVLAEDGTIDREATRENIHAKVTRPDSGPAPTPLAAPSPAGRYDVNRDGAISPLDALTVINVLNGHAVAEVMTYDVNQDGAVTPLDVLHVINRLNNRVVPQVSSTFAIDSFFAEDEDDEDEDGTLLV